jgi:hypothetical protein
MNDLIRVMSIGVVAGIALICFTASSEAGPKKRGEYYAPRYQRLPPGLQKKLRRTGQLPPGWQKRLAPFPVVVERQLIVLPHGYRRGVLDGHAVVFDPRNQSIIDVADLF